MGKSVNIIILEWNPKNSEFYASEGFDQFELSRQDFHGYFKDLNDDKSVHPTDIGRLSADFFDYMRKGLEHPGLNIRLKRIDGKYEWCDFESHYVKDENKDIIKAICTISVYGTTNKDGLEESKEGIYDNLTGLYNRDAFCTVMHELAKNDRQKKYALIQWDMGRFRIYNDMFGYEEGDKLLKYMAVKMKDFIGEIGECSRVFADHFYAVISNENKNVEKFIFEMRQTLNEYRKDFEILPYFAIYIIEDPDMPKQKICNNVRLAMIEAKNSGDTHIAYFENEIIEKTISEKEVIERMKQALFNEEFEVYLQPKFFLTTGDLAGAEALIRWNHPDKGLIEAKEFLQVLEMSGFIKEIDEFVWDKVCSKIKYWKEKGYPIYPISVNISRIHLYNPELVEDLTGLTEKYSIQPNLIEIEIMEDYYSEDPDQLISVAKKLQSKGFKISMDDFGTGYASFHVLNKMPIDTIKIDKEYIENTVKEEQVKNVVKTIINLSKMVDIPVVAECVENKEQTEFLRKIRCDYAQGHYFEKAISFEEYEEKYVQDNFLRLVEVEEGFKNEDIDRFWNPSMMIDLMCNNIVESVGIFEYKDDSIKVLRADSGYFKIMKCDLKSYKEEDRNVWNRIIEKDRVTSLQRISVAGETKCVIDFDFRAVSPDNKICVYNAKVLYLMGDKNNFIFYGTLKDVTIEREIKNRLKVKEEGYKILFESTNVITFDYDVDNDYFSYVLKKPDDSIVEKSYENFISSNIKLEHIHEDSLKDFLDLFECASKNKVKGSLDFLANFMGYGYSWCRVYYVSVPDDEGNIYRVVGQVLDIQHEKDEFDIIKHKSQRDQMTGVYNKLEARRMIQNYLSNNELSGKDVLMLFDLDDFRKVNDNYGHIIGDLVIKKVATVLEKVFSIKDIVARFGGDEFIVFLKNIPMDVLQERIKTFYELFEIEQTNGKIDIGCSIGIAFANDKAKDFDSLIEYADIAMFEAKQKGKNQYIIYDD